MPPPHWWSVAEPRDLKEGVALAARSVDSGAAKAKLDHLVALSQELAGH